MHFSCTVKISAGILLSLFLAGLIGCTTERHIRASQPPELIRSNPGQPGLELILEFHRGKYHNHPTFAIWIEDMEGRFIETLFVTRYAATGIFGHGELEPGRWKAEPGPAVRPATLPYWFHKRGEKSGTVPDIPTPEKPVPDAISGATPVADFILKTNTATAVPSKFRLLMEINQTWDSNHYWTNNKYPDDPEYFTSLQPALVYAVSIDLESGISEYFLNPIGHSHYSGKNGLLYTDLTTFTTALQIAEKIIVRVSPR